MFVNGSFKHLQKWFFVCVGSGHVHVTFRDCSGELHGRTAEIHRQLKYTQPFIPVSVDAKGSIHSAGFMRRSNKQPVLCVCPVFAPTIERDKGEPTDLLQSLK